MAGIGSGRVELMKRAYAVIDRQQARIAELEAQATRSAGPAEPIAIVGAACRFPGAPGLDAYWDLLASGREAISEAPPDRWDSAALFDPDPETPGRMYTRHGGFLEGIDQFDAACFGISPREARAMDPQQRLLLETAWEALDHAGQPRDRLAGSPTGVFIGITSSEYARGDAAALEQIDAYYVTGNTLNAAAGRLSYVLGFSGPCLAVDTACSSSLVAVHLACRAIRQGECDRAVVGGVHLMVSPVGHIALCQTRVLSPSGRCRTFDAGADGMVRGEGCGVVVLRRLDDAARDRDRVLALVRGSAVNQDGPSTGLTVPNGLAQVAVIERALADAGAEPGDIDYVEAHGTATPLGDPIEIEALGQTLGRGRPTDKPLLIGSVKTNIGHLEAASGMAGLIKVVLALDRGLIPAHLHLTEPTTRARWDRWPLAVVTSSRPWERTTGAAGPNGHIGQRGTTGTPRLAGVSGFGFSGTNAHVVVEEAPTQPRPVAGVRRGTHVVSLSARSETALRSLAARYGAHLRGTTGVSLGDVSYTANTGRAVWAERLCVVASGVGEAAAQLDAASTARPAPGVLRGRMARVPRVGWLCSAASAWAAAGPRLYREEPVFRAVVDAVAAAVPETVTVAPETLVGLTLPDETSSTAHATAVLAAAVASAPSPAEAAVAELARGCGLAALWQAWGVRPWAVTGAGVGAYVAAVTAGVFEASEAARLLVAQMRTRTLDGATHRQALAALRAVAQGVRYREPQVRYVTTDAPNAPDAPEAPEAQEAGDLVLTPAYWERPPERAAALAPTGCELVLELGVAAGTAPTVGTLPGLAGGPSGLAGSLGVDASAADSLFATLAALWVRGGAVDWQGVHRDDGHRKTTLPSYPWERQRYWHAEASRQTSTGAGLEAWTYRLTWEPPADAAGATTPVVGTQGVVPAALAGPLTTHLDALRTDPGLRRYGEALDALEIRAAWHAAKTLERLGVDRAAGARVDEARLAARHGVASARRPLLRRLLTMLGEAGQLSAEQDGWTVTADREPAACETGDELAERYPEAEREIQVLDRCGAALPAVLAGRQDPLALLFPSDGSVTAAALYGDTVLSRTMHGIAARVVAAVVDGSRDDRTLRVLEIGGGTGGLTAAIVSHLRATPSTYLFTDVSPSFLAPARERFGEVAGFDTARLDIERDPIAQGFEAAGFDLIVAADVLHATRDLRESVTHVARLLAPGGLLVLLEGTRPRRAIDLIFGLTDGWWRFDDRDLRPTHPLIGPSAWRDVLATCGFGQVQIFGSDVGDSGVLASQAVVVAQRTEAVATPAAGRPVQVVEQADVAVEHWVVLADRGQTGRAVTEQLRVSGAQVSVVPADVTGHDTGGWGALVSADTPVSAVVDLRALDLPNAATLSGAGAQHAVERVCADLAELVRRLAPAATRRLALHLVTRGAVAAAGEAVEGVVQAAVWGLGKVIALEHPELPAFLHDLDPQNRPADAARLLVEGMRMPAGETLQVTRGGHRHVARLEPYPVDGLPPFRCDATAAYLVTGGLGGLGLLLAEWLASKGAGHVVLAGRHPPSRPASDAIEALEAAGQRISVVQADVADPDAVEAVVAQIGAGGCRLAGVFHAAGHLDDGILTTLDPQRVSAVLKPKVHGAWNLHLATRELPLDCFVLFSAATSLIGSPGQASHAAANAFLDALAHHRRAERLPAVSINWGAWAQAGAVAGGAAAARVRLKGLRLMAPGPSLAILDRLVTSETAQIGVFDVDWSRVPASLTALPLLSRCVPSTRPAARLTGDQEQDQHGDGDRSGAPGSRRRVALAAYVRQQVRQVLAMPDGAALDMEQGFFDLGMDSLTSMELRGRLQTGLGRPLSATAIFDYPTPAALVAHLNATQETSSAAQSSGPEDPAPSTESGAPAALHGGDDHRDTDGQGAPDDDHDDIAARLSRKLAELHEELAQ